MKIDVSAGLVGFDGKPIFDSAESMKQVTLKQLLVMAGVNANLQKHGDGEKKYRIYVLVKKIDASETELELAAEDVTLLKVLVGEYFPVAVVGPVFDLLEGK